MLKFGRRQCPRHNTHVRPGAKYGRYQLKSVRLTLTLQKLFPLLSSPAKGNVRFVSHRTYEKRVPENFARGEVYVRLLHLAGLKAKLGDVHDRFAATSPQKVNSVRNFGWHLSTRRKKFHPILGRTQHCFCGIDENVTV